MCRREGRRGEFRITEKGGRVLDEFVRRRFPESMEVLEGLSRHPEFVAVGKYYENILRELVSKKISERLELISKPSGG